MKKLNVYNMKKTVLPFLAVACVSIICFSSCGVYDAEQYHKTTYIDDFFKMGEIDVRTSAAVIEGKDYVQLKISPTSDVQSVLSMYDEDTKPFYQLCKEHGDENYCDRWVHKVDEGPLFSSSYLADEIETIEVITKGQWDAVHPAGSSLNDLIHFVGLSIQPFIDSSYEMYNYGENQLSEYFYSLYPFREGYDKREWYPIDKPLKELTANDMRLWGLGCPGLEIDHYTNVVKEKNWEAFLATLILPAHEGDMPVKVEVTLTDRAGKTFTSEVEI